MHGMKNTDMNGNIFCDVNGLFILCYTVKADISILNIKIRGQKKCCTHFFR